MTTTDTRPAGFPARSRPPQREGSTTVSDTLIETDWFAGEQTPERAKELADGMAETIRALNYATKIGAGGLEYPSHVYDLLANLYIGTGRLPQLVDQLGAFLAELEGKGVLADGPLPGGPASAAAIEALREAAGAAAQLTEALQQAQNAISNVSYKSED